jgi:hypothetical protein
MFKSRNSFVIIYSLLVLLEVLFVLYFNKGTFAQQTNSAGLFLTSVFTGVFTIGWFYNKPLTPELTSSSSRNRTWLLLAIWASGLVLAGLVLVSIFHNNPIDAKTSDIIPTLQVATQRFLLGEMPYKTISKWGYELPLTYLPLQWGPYMFAEVLDFDYRWVALGILALAGDIVVYRARVANHRFVFIVPLFLSLALLAIYQFNDSILIVTIEIMVAGYYMLMIAGVVSNHAVLRGVVLALCLLSRYSLMLWLPLWFAVELLNAGGRKKLAITVLTVVAVVLVLYVLPFLSKDPSIFIKGYKYYTQAALGEWQHLDDQGRPAHLYAGNGFAYLFFERFANLPLLDRIHKLQKTHLLACLGSSVLMMIWYFLNRQKIDRRIFLMGSFKIYLAVFLSLIQVPYSYLMITGVFVSIAILAEAMRLRSVMITD